MTRGAEPAKVYALSGAGAPSDSASANTSSLPDILRRHGRSNKRTKRKATSKSSASINAQLDRIELIQDYEFPEASNKIKSTRDGSSLVATGTYKPHIRVWELDQLSLKFERHTNSENIDFVLLSDDWTKQLHLQTDRTLELHAQGGHHTRVRIPKFGRALAYHFPSAEALVGAAGSEVYRLNLDYGRFMAPYQLGQGTGQGEVTGCNAVDVNPAHGLLAFGTEGAGVVELWDQRARRRAGALSITTPVVMDAALSAARRGLPGLILPGEDANEAAVTNAMSGLSVSALSSAQDGLNLAVGTSTGHVLLYDLRMDRPYTTKDQGFSLPIKSLSWPGDAPPATNFSTTSSQAHRAASSEARDTVLSADSKGIKVWSKTDPTSNLVSISPQSGCDLNDVHHLPGSGLLFAAVEGTQCAAWYVPTLGPAPKWCSFLDRVTDEIDEEQMSGGKRGVYEDFKFLDRPELDRLNMSHLIGSNVLRPYMHGYFVALPLYERARLLANPSSFEDAREKAIKAKLEKKAESRIRSSGAKKALEGFNAKVQVNKDLAEKAAREQDREEQRQLALAATAAEAGDGAAAGEAAPRTKKPSKASLLGDDRFKELFTNPEFQVDQTSRDSAAVTAARNNPASKRRTAVEEEEDESDRESLDPDQEEDREREQELQRREQPEAESDSDEGDLSQYDPRNHAPGTKRRHLEKAAKLQAQARKKGRGARLACSRRRQGTKHFRRQDQSGRPSRPKKPSSSSRGGVEDDDDEAGGAHSMTFIPSSAPDEDSTLAGHDYTHQDAKRAERQKRERSFGAGLSKGSEAMDLESLGEEDRSGRKKRRDVSRSASKNVMRR
ncbi:hypothetical protein BCV69DRAFT_289098 [Microstroma glucosiphilum]|uniref:Uncharacterized protein n=1 Tax=Pseudomicrostroma glucosiphilum TaxID=1684307 RepID=A0A316UH20_9BASI|nr:hypothetical protein BCV69DRAFT_289098 [Pseudomicrostroma glucosiphilum]PWN24218.1 hypothetical protein BCV69DRAFT_289098 [Pseudomicrostroma glucosiphilum]